MGKRFCEKTAVNLYAKIIIGDKTYNGYIENVSQEGAEYLMTCLINVSTEAKAKKITEIHFKVSSKDSEDFKPEKTAEVHFQTPSGEAINLNCEVIWFSVSQYDNRTEVFGMAIINPPAQYKEFLKSLNTADELVEQEFIIDNLNHEYESSYNQTNYEDRKKVHIIIAEDNIVDQKMALSILERPDYAVEVANNGKEVLEGLKKQHVDIVLMDVHMPKMDGIEATQAIRNSKDNVFNTEIPIIAVTAQAFEEEKERCLKAGMNSYVTKPLKREELYKEIEKHTQAVNMPSECNISSDDI